MLWQHGSSQPPIPSWIAERSHHVTDEASPFTAATAGPRAGWLVGLVQVLELTINRTTTAIVASGPEVSPA